MRTRQVLAVGVSVAIVLAAYVAWESATGSFNPNPRSVSLDTTSCDLAAPPCPAFSIDSANLTVKSLQDIRSQELTIRVSAEGPSRIDVISVYFSGIPIGNFTGGLSPGRSASLGWGIPTTQTVNPGDSYTILVRALYDNHGSPRVVAEYWNSYAVVAR